MELAATCVLGQGLRTNVQPELQRGRIMPQFCRFLGVNSVTNIELPTGFVPVLIFKFADWLENFSAQEPGRRLSLRWGFRAHIL